MSSRFDFALVVSKATSLASSSRTEGEGAGTGTPVCCKGVDLRLSAQLAVERKRSADLARALMASTSRSRGGALVTRESMSSRAALETLSTARSKAASFVFDGRVQPESLRTNCSEDK